MSNGENYQTKTGELLDDICHRYYQGRPNTVETVLNANPGLAKLGPIIPKNTVVFLPEIPVSEDDNLISLWD